MGNSNKILAYEPPIHKVKIGKNQYRCQYANGDHYEGGFRKGKKQGIGVLTYSRIFIDTDGNKVLTSGNRYTGEFANDLPNGKGQLLYESGNYYEGDFLDGYFHGKGKLTSSTCFINKITFVNGECYEGNFIYGKMCGVGIFKTKNFNNEVFYHGVSYVGEFDNTMFNGKGILHYLNEFKYEGTFKDNKFYGYGLIKYANGDCYRGEFRDNKKHGQGVEIQGDSCFSGEFVDNEFVPN